MKINRMIEIIILCSVFVDGKRRRHKHKTSETTEDDDQGFEADVFCKNESRLIRLERADEIFIVDTAENSTILLQCKFCEERDNGLPKIWSRQKHIFTGNITELETEMNNNLTSSRLFVTKAHSLVIRFVQETNMGLYFCKAPYVDTPDKSFIYLIDLNTKGLDNIQGTSEDLKNYTETYLKKVNEVLDNETFVINKIPVKMTVYTDWTDWSTCDSCFRKKGIKYRLGRCRVKPICIDLKQCMERRQNLRNFVFNDKQNVEKPKEVLGEVANKNDVEENIVELGIALSCRSYLLRTLTPDLFFLTYNIPDFMESDFCKGVCKGRILKRGPRYRKSIILAKGAHLTLVCPDSNIDSDVQWLHNKLRLHPSEGSDYIPQSKEPRLYVDSFNTLYLFDVTDEEAGNYTCFVNGIRMQEVRIIILTRSMFFTKEFTRHLKYLGLLFVFCFFGYLSGIIIMFTKTKTQKPHKGKKHPDKEKLLRRKCYDSESDTY